MDSEFKRVLDCAALRTLRYGILTRFFVMLRVLEEGLQGFLQPLSRVLTKWNPLVKIWIFLDIVGASG